jgi:hypothetical protein|tara:strand:+ start:51 stop:503 length:453 start_codon:yes stop_codon:yes gene_type:complete
MGVVGAALRGFGKALSKKSGTIKSVPIAKHLTTKRAIQDKVVRAVDEGTKKGLGGATPSPHLKQSVSKSKRVESKKLKDYSYKWDKLVSDKKKAGKKLIGKTIGAGAAAVGGITGAHGVAKHKFPKYKKFMESDIKTVDGKLKIVPKKKK